MNAEQYLNEALGGNMNISTLKPLAWHEIMEGYARQKIKEEKFTSTNKRYAAALDVWKEYAHGDRWRPACQGYYTWLKQRLNAEGHSA